VQVVESARPDVGPMPAVERRHLREHLFDVAMRSQSDHEPLELASPNTRAANALRVGALALLGLFAIGGLAYSASRDTPTSPGVDPSATTVIVPTAVEPTRATVVQAPRPTTAPTTTTPPVAGSAESPLLLPPERNRLDELRVTRAELGGSSLLLRAPDLSTISLREADGVVPESEPPTTDVDGVPVPTVPPRRFGDLDVLAIGDDEPGRYDVTIACGTFTVLDGTTRSPFRPQIVELFDAMRVENGVISIALPDGWDLVSSGPSTDEFVFGLPVEIGERQVTVTLAQFPGGSLAMAGYDGRDYAPTTFGGQTAWIHRDTEVPGAFDLISMIGSTAYRVSTRDVTLAELESLIAQLTPGDVDEWVSRFGALPVSSDPDIRTCPAQPEFVIE
jgi:hypothetical protein